MKKLMIAAAAAALVSGAFAEVTKETAYTFTASVKTTVGKVGKVTSTYTLGVNDVGDTFWYEDDLVAADEVGLKDLYPAYFATKSVGGTRVPCLTSAAKKDYDFLSQLATIAADYNNPSAGKWCETFKVVETGCYRVAGTKKFTDVVTGDLCCESLSGLVVTGIDLDLAQRFGGMTYPTAKKVEVLGTIDADDSDREDGKGRTIDGTLAGQGSVGKVQYYLTDTDNGENDGLYTETLGITSISGYLVGTLNAPDCANCCALNEDAIAFTCGDATPDASLETAGYGTFSLKYNAKATKALAD